MKTKMWTEGPTALENFRRVMKTLFRVPKAAIQPQNGKPAGQKKAKHPR